MTRFVLTCIVVLLPSFSVFSQYTIESERLAQLFYMENAHEVNCDSIGGVSILERICLNKTFQEVDSILNERIQCVLEAIESDSTKDGMVVYHEAWIENRRAMSKLVVSDLAGHQAGIEYLHSMVTITSRRLRELDQLIEGMPNGSF